jgi:hypothetical protein
MTVHRPRQELPDDEPRVKDLRGFLAKVCGQVKRRPIPTDGNVFEPLRRQP